MFCVAETADGEQLAQLQILYKAQQRQIEDLERKLEDSRRKMRYVEHQFAIVKGMFYSVFTLNEASRNYLLPSLQYIDLNIVYCVCDIIILMYINNAYTYMRFRAKTGVY